MNSINFYSGTKFPMYREALAKMQDMINLVATLAGLGGQNFILSGCTTNSNGTITDGLVIINGELLPFTGGVLKTKITVKETRQSVTAFDVVYPETYITRIAQFSDTGEYTWADFSQVKTNTELYKMIRDITGDAPGTVKMWAGMVSKIPTDYKLCDGLEVLITDYPDLYENIGVSFGGDGQNTFNLPDLRGRFIVGFDSANPDYNAISKEKIGGNAEVALNVEQIPAHQHIVPWGENLNTAWQPTWGYPSEYFNNSRGYKAETDNDNTWPYTSPSGGDSNSITKGHENRPPYFTLAYIIKVR